MTEPRRYERIDVELPCRLYVPGERGLKFEAHCTSRNLGLGGVFLSSSFLLREGLELFVELGLPAGPLAIRARVAHTVPGDHPELEGGFGVEFLDVDAAGRETLLRYFTPLRYHEFYRAFAGEFPHLRDRVPVADVALLLNLWEEWKAVGEGGPAFTASGAPPAPARAGAGPARRGRR
ncbi:type IV pilus assembly PilZ [Anaeromyxobacter dehalogenans 2CP-1]|uniref:Type IV pilus assembly PilZ n=1 Tax=Anaeromyxobacter dehalogenans (strain ATCC BAA-258 / DSM 21875 / 2CP-1) TaxID=455488 RepID=B8J8Q9_ANAD2|nr:PilZ domain-containing protein [Anaeromyxobacter dehalogenans]ACL63507.1 type IV pilus assembly PilZ [Anaeromyxobacter dehalogenans 2CP-1]